MNRYIKLLSKRTTFVQRSTVTFIRNVKTMPTIEDMPHPKSLPIVGTRIDLLAAGSGKKLHEYVDKRHKQLGSIFYEQLGGSTKLVFISDSTAMKSLFLNLEGKYPTHLLPDPWILYEKLYGNRRGLFFMNGEEWLSNRRMMNTHLLKEDSEKWMLNPILSTVDRFINNWKNKSENNTFVPMLESDFYRFSTEAIISVLLGNSTLKPNKHSNMMLNIFSESVKKIFQTTTKLYGLPIEVYHRFNLKGWRDFKDSVDTSLSLAQKIVVDMLQKTSENQGLIKKLREENLSDEIITRLVADFVIAAGDTTAHTLLWILYLISNRQELIKEVRTRDQQHVKHIIKETMRLYPVAPFLTRILPKESILNGYKLEEGTPIIASIYTSGRDEKYFSKADQFLPYRWDRSDPRRKGLENHIPSASMPFALGARSCIGRKLAMLQITELIYQIVNQFDLKCLNENEIKAITSQVLIPSEDIKIAVSQRSQ